MVWYSEGGVQYIFAGFVDLQSRYYYNLEKRKRKGKRYKMNSGNFLAMRMLYTGPDVASSFVRFDNHSFSVGPTWGIQRAYRKLNLAYSMGPEFYFDTMGNGNWFPFSFELNLGINLNRKN